MRSYLVVGNQTLDSPELAEAIRDRLATGPATFHIVVPATPIQHGLTWPVGTSRVSLRTEAPCLVVLHATDGEGSHRSVHRVGR